MQADEQERYLLLDRYLAGEGLAADDAAIREWLAEHPENVRLLEDLRFIRKVLAQRVPPSHLDTVWKKTAAASAPPPPPPTTSKRGFFRITLAMAAGIALVLLVKGVFWQPAKWQELSTDATHHASIRFADGSRIGLAPRTRIRYRVDRRAREVYLEGHAYFEVRHDAARPFRVRTRGSVTEDLGTAFVVRAYSDQPATEVIVAEGRVRVWAAEPLGPPALELTAGDLGRLDSRGKTAIRHGVDVERYVAWTRGLLVFNSAALREVLPALSRWYGVELRLGDSTLAQRRLTARFDNEPLSMVLDRMALTLGLRIERRAGAVLLFRQHR
jgi:transmembrane sensor